MDKRGGTYLRTLVVAALLGVPVAVAAVAFQTAIHDVIHLVWEVVPHWLDWSAPPAWYVILVPGVAGVLVAAAVRLPGHGGHSPLEGLGMSALDPRDLGSILLASLATLGLGLVLGPEAPLVALGLGLGVVATRVVRSEGADAQPIVFAGAFAAIAALFGGPVVAAFLLFELSAAGGAIPPKAMVRAFLPGFLAAGTGSLVFTGIGDWRGLHQTTLALPSLQAYETVRLVDLGWCLPIATTIALVVVAIHHLAHGVSTRVAPRPELALVVAGLVVGLLAVAFRAAADRPVDLVLFSGQSELPAVIAEGSAGVLLLLVLAKGLAYAISLGAGFRGGPVFPALAVGVAIAVASADLLPGLASTPAIAMGIAAAAAAALRVPFSAVLFASLLAGSSAADVVPIAIFAAAVGWIVATALPNPEDRGRAEEAPAPAG